MGDFFSSKLCSFCKRFRGRVIIFGDGKGMKSKGTTANIREARISYARITDFSRKSRYTIFARKLVGQLSTLPIIIAVRSKIHESEEISPSNFPTGFEDPFIHHSLFLFFFFFFSMVFPWWFDRLREEIIPAWIGCVFISISFISINTSTIRTISTPNYSTLNLWNIRFQRFPWNWNFRQTFQKSASFFSLLR